jgi:hypothetical protein
MLVDLTREEYTFLKEFLSAPGLNIPIVISPVAARLQTKFRSEFVDASDKPTEKTPNP